MEILQNDTYLPIREKLCDKVRRHSIRKNQGEEVKETAMGRENKNESCEKVIDCC